MVSTEWDRIWYGCCFFLHFHSFFCISVSACNTFHPLVVGYESMFKCWKCLWHQCIIRIRCFISLEWFYWNAAFNIALCSSVHKLAMALYQLLVLFSVLLGEREQTARVHIFFDCRNRFIPRFVKEVAWRGEENWKTIRPKLFCVNLHNHIFIMASYKPIGDELIKSLYN